MNDPKISEHEGYWSVTVEGASITRISFEWAVILLINSKSGSFEVRIENSFTLKGPDQPETIIDPESGPEQLAPALLLLHMDVEYLHALKDGGLEIGLAGGASVHVDASDEYEPWELISPDKTRIVSTPAKELAIWRS